ncbi:M20 family metallopeptidase [Aurantimonas sp. VKM B-3413]|uniref:M20 family metallopeptidase n=1 Tax=Aurantimonas sp. VKM B-3413 TaxID=2779401 RepID=UPI001E5E63D5|nr:M20 family metallopeptidase [Aurantimonas sp. VKM B-3413]MCB8839471.1 M20 family metallopeptidase [Aurantimonas sp. VKM B-3413]
MTGASLFAATDIDLGAFLTELRAWVEIETPSREPQRVNRLADRVADRARANGLSVRRTAGTMGYGDILSVTFDPEADADRLLILAHLDTVHPVGTLERDLPWRETDGRIFGPGIYDMKSGALMALHALELAAKRAGAELPPVEILLVSDEEVGSKSSRPLIEAAAKRASHVLVVEPARDGGQIVVARKGVAMIDILVTGRASHAGTRPQDGRSAIREAARLVLQLEALNDPARGVTVTVGTIQGGTGRNVVPAECRLAVDIRLPDAEAAAEILAIVEGLAPSDPDIAIEVAGGLNRPPFTQSAAARRLFDKAAALGRDLGLDLKGQVTGGGSDGNFTAAMGVPTLDGLGADGAGAHTHSEHILTDSLAARTALLANLMLSRLAD